MGGKRDGEKMDNGDFGYHCLADGVWLDRVDG
jgi:hypothetical protein